MRCVPAQHPLLISALIHDPSSPSAQCAGCGIASRPVGGWTCRTCGARPRGRAYVASSSNSRGTRSCRGGVSCGLKRSTRTSRANNCPVGALCRLAVGPALVGSGHTGGGWRSHECRQPARRTQSAFERRLCCTGRVGSHCGWAKPRYCPGSGMVDVDCPPLGPSERCLVDVELARDRRRNYRMRRVRGRRRWPCCWLVVDPQPRSGSAWPSLTHVFETESHVVPWQRPWAGTWPTARDRVWWAAVRGWPPKYPIQSSRSCTI